MNKKKKILFIYNSYQEYSDQIIKSINNIAKYFICLCLTPNINIFESFLDIIFNGKYSQKKSLSLQYNSISEIDNFDIDYVFVLSGHRLSMKLLSFLKNKCKKAKFILYLWDDIARVDGMLNKILFFDRVFSFDSNDCKKYGFIFLPLFYTENFENFSREKITDLFFCGATHSNRIYLLEKLHEFALNHNLKLDSNLYISFWGYLHRYFVDSTIRKYNDYFITKSLSLNDFAKYLCSSKVCVDMQHKSQTGLTMRCIESLPAQTKIITTNEHIKEYDFYCPENVMIIDRDNPVFDVDFIKSPYKPIPKEIVEKYSLENWVKTIFMD